MSTVSVKLILGLFDICDVLIYRDEMDIGAKIKNLRGDRTIYEIAELAGVSQQFISQIERGNKSPSIKTLHKLAKALGVTSEVLLGDVVATQVVQNLKGNSGNISMNNGIHKTYTQENRGDFFVIETENKTETENKMGKSHKRLRLEIPRNATEDEINKIIKVARNIETGTPVEAENKKAAQTS